MVHTYLPAFRYHLNLDATKEFVGGLGFPLSQRSLLFRRACLASDTFRRVILESLGPLKSTGNSESAFPKVK